MDRWLSKSRLIDLRQCAKRLWLEVYRRELREDDPSDCIAGIVYAFIRGTRGADAPADAAGRRHGMFVWQPPAVLWPRLSGLFAGVRP